MTGNVPELIDTPRGRMTRREAATAFGLAYGTVCRRVWEEWPPERAFSAPEVKYATPPARRRRRRLRRGYFMTPWGRMGLAQVALKIGISRNSLSARLYSYRWPQELAFNTAPLGRPGVNYIMPPAEYRRLVQEQHRRENADAGIAENGARVRVTYVRQEKAT